MLALLLLLATQSAREVDHAKQLYAAGTEAYESANYNLAIKSFERAYELAPRPNVAYALAQAHRFQYYADQDPTKLTRAVELYQSYLSDVKEGGFRKEASTHLGDLLRLVPSVASVQASTVEPAQRPTELMLSAQPRTALVRVDDREPIAVPSSVVVDPGNHVVLFFADGHEDDRQEIVAVEGRLIPVKGTLTPKPASLTVKVETGAEVIIDGRKEGVAPIPAVTLSAGKHFLAISSNGRRPFSKELDLGLGAAEVVDVQLRSTPQRAFAYVFFAAFSLFATVTGLTATGVFRENSLAKSIDQDSTRRALTIAEAMSFSEHVQRRDDLVGATIGIGSVAGVTLITGLLLFFFDQPDAPEAPRTQAE